ncbi:MAG: hypothetical protein QOG88_1561, partial [Actinomycetota bacterium]|nr:hypothetical protein [Actinomycetota bacterium]
CAPTGTKLTIAAQNVAFDKSCLAVAADTPFTIEFDNKDAGIQHNVSIFDGASALFQKSDAQPGPVVVNYDVGALKAGDYSFKCDFHPTTMFGTFIVAAK